MDDYEKMERLKQQTGERIARAISADIDREGKELHGAAFMVDEPRRLEAIEHWTALAVQVLNLTIPQFKSDLDEVVKLMAAAEGRWSDLHERVRRLWFEDLGWPLPMLGPPADKTVDCDCKGEWADCPWCGGCGWLVPRMKKLLQDATTSSKEPKNAEEDEERVIKDRRALESMLFVEQMHRLGATRVDVTPRGGVRVDFPPRKEKVPDTKPGRLCENCTVWMNPRTVDGQTEWTCPNCSRVTKDGY